MSIRWQSIRARAAAVRTRYATETSDSAPDLLPLDDVLDSYLLSAFDDPALDPRINGELNPVIGSIRLRPGMSPERRRFIIAHELGHFMLENASTLYEDDETTIDERAGGGGEHDAGVLRGYNTRERHEYEANLFAIELLIPADALWCLLQILGWNEAVLAAQFGVSLDAIRSQIVNVCCLEPVAVDHAPDTHALVIGPPDDDQQAAVDAPLPTLVVAGPGTGKTRSIVAKYLALVDQGVDPRTILALTFSNKAAEEMRARIIMALDQAHPALGTSVDVSTFHAWGLNLLKGYGQHLDLPPEIQLRATGDLFILLKRRIADLPLTEYKDIRNPGHYLPQIIGAISRAKDELCDPIRFRELAEVQAEQLIAAAELQQAGKTTQTAQKARARAATHAARLRELAAIYARYETILREERVLDYGDLIMRAVEVLRIPAVGDAIRAQYQYILVDEFQDINYASGELVRLLDGGRGRVWVVGDPWQSIYRFRGASSANIQAFPSDYGAEPPCQIRRNYRSLQPILDASHAIMRSDPQSVDRQPLQSQRSTAKDATPVVEWIADTPDDEAAAIAHDILRRVRGSQLRRRPCARTIHHRALRRVPISHTRMRRNRWRFADHVVLCRTHAQAARVVAALEAHDIAVDSVGDIFDATEVKDALAMVALARSTNDAGMLRALTIAGHALSSDDFTLLIRLAHAAKRSLPRATRDSDLVAQLSPAGQHAINDLHIILQDLAGAHDAWQVVVRYLFTHSIVARERIVQSGRGDTRARRALATLGQLVLVAQTFVRQAPPDARSAAAFIDYARALIEAGETGHAAPALDHADVVRVMTIHSAKGLEFPIVYVPGLQNEQFPGRRQSTSIPDLPSMIHGALGDDVQDERYLLYVAMTRARDRLVLSYARTRNGKPATRSSLLPGSMDGAGAPWPVRQIPHGRPCRVPARPLRLTVAPLTRSPIPASSLETYKACPRSYLYQYGYQLYDDRSPYLRMHQTIRQVVQELSQRARDGLLPQDEQELRDLTWSVFATHELPDALYSEDYFAEAFRHIQHVWQDLRASGRAPDDLNQIFVVGRPSGAVSVRVDRMDQQADGSRWVRTRSGRAGDNDHLNLQIMLYALAARDQGVDGEIMLHYTATGTMKRATPRPDVLTNHTAEIDDLLAGIQAGHWEPRPGPACATCAFNLICPA